MASIAATIVPTAKRLLPEQYMPSFAKGYFAFGDFTITWGPWIMLAFVIMLAVIFGSMQRWTGPQREWFDPVRDKPRRSGRGRIARTA